MNINIYLNLKKIDSLDEQAIAEYVKRLGAYCKISIIKKMMSEASVLEHYFCQSKKAHTLSFFVNFGKDSMASESLAQLMEESAISGISSMNFYVGYECAKSLKGVEDAKLVDPANIRVLNLTSFSLSTGVAATLLTEQLYRGYRILNHQPYHK